MADPKVSAATRTRAAGSPVTKGSLAPSRGGFRIKIAWKITAVIVLVMLALGIANILLVRSRLRSVMTEQFQSQARAIALSLAAFSEDRLRGGATPGDLSPSEYVALEGPSPEDRAAANIKAVQSLADRFRRIDGVRYVYVVNGLGEVVVHTFGASYPAELKGANTPAPSDEFSAASLNLASVGNVLEVAVPVSRGSAGAAHVGMSSASITAEIRRVTASVLTQFAVAAVVAVLLLHLVVTFVLRHLKTVIAKLERVASGDLTTRMDIRTNDEFAFLGDQVNSTCEQLGGTIARVRHAFAGISQNKEKISRVFAEVLEGIEQQAGLAGETMDSVRSTKKMSDEVTAGIHVLENSANDSFSSIIEMGASIEEVSAMSETLFKSASESNRAVEALSRSIDDISRNLQALSRASDETASAMNEMGASIVEVRGNAETTSQDAVGMTRIAEEGALVSKNAMTGMLAIKESSAQVSGLITTVTTRIEEIDEILSFITDITGKTNLLALNAAIIAAQAGAQGKGFGVVADEINELAQNTKAQTNRIAQVIQGIREEVSRTGEAVEESTRKVEEGVRLAEQVTAALEKIMESTMEVSHRVEEIAQTTSEQARTSNRVLETTENLTQSAGNIKEVSLQQVKSGEKLLEMSRRVQEAAEKVRTSTEEQTVTSQQINKDLTRISDTVRTISESTEIQVVNGAKVLRMSEDLSSVVEKNRKAVHGLEEVIRSLSERVDTLQKDLAALKVLETPS